MAKRFTPEAGEALPPRRVGCRVAWAVALSGCSAAELSRLPPRWARLIELLLQPSVVVGVTLVSLVLFLGSLLIGSWAVRRLPVDYLVSRAAPPTPRGMARWGQLLRNALGVVLLLIGVLMLVLPGQGLLTILAALSLLDFPGKKKLELRLLSLPRVLATVNHLRRRAGRLPLHVPDQARHDSTRGRH
jgi:hypothetical protein